MFNPVPSSGMNAQGDERLNAPTQPTAGRNYPVETPREMMLTQAHEVERRWGRWKMLAANYLFEDLFWRNQREPVPWLEELIRR
jgi:hypothetical protein